MFRVASFLTALVGLLEAIGSNGLSDEDATALLMTRSSLRASGQGMRDDSDKTVPDNLVPPECEGLEELRWNLAGAQLYNGGPTKGTNHTENACECQALCKRTQGCWAWTFSSSAFVTTYNNKLYNCWLRSAYGGVVHNCGGTCISNYIKNSPADPWTFSNFGGGCPWVSVASVAAPNHGALASTKNGNDKQCQCTSKTVGRWETWQMVKVDDPTCESAFYSGGTVAILSQQTGKYMNAAGGANIGANVADYTDSSSHFIMTTAGLSQFTQNFQDVKLTDAGDSKKYLECGKIQLEVKKSDSPTWWEVTRLGV